LVRVERLLNQFGAGEERMCHFFFGQIVIFAGVYGFQAEQ
jgi:hypothetical protein